MRALGLDHCIEALDRRPAFAQYRLSPTAVVEFAPNFDTTQLCARLGLDPERPDDLRREILLAMLASPIAFDYPSFEELDAAVRIRENIVRAARKTALAFDTVHAERPEEYWTYSEETGFVLRPGKALVEALEKTTQPERSGMLYSFSCYRATEYVILLGIAQELARSNPPQLEQLQRQWETRAIMSGRFHDVFLREYGSMEAPLPSLYYVPGDRLWFRNPDDHSSNVEGYEGSWVFYMGGGQYTNFWKRDQPFTLTSKCVELYHWRHGTYRDANNQLMMDEGVVEARVRASLGDPAETQRILDIMCRWRDPGGVYAQGGCIDTTRECARFVCPGTSELVFSG